MKIYLILILSLSLCVLANGTEADNSAKYWKLYDNAQGADAKVKILTEYSDHIYYNNPEFQEMLYEVDKLLPEIENPYWKYKLFTVHLSINLFDEDFDTAERYLQLTRQIAEETKIDSIVYEQKQTEGYYLDFIGKSQEALVFYKEIYDYIIEKKSPAYISNFIDNLVLVYEKLYLFDSVIKTYLDFLSYCENRNITDYHFSIHNGIAYTYTYIKQTDEAVNYFESALDFAEMEQNRDKISIVLSNLGSIHLDLNDYDKAIDYYKRSIDVIGEEDSQNLATSYNNLGVAQTSSGDYTGAEKNIYKAIELYKEKDLEDDYANAYLNLADLFVRSNRLEEAETYLNQGLEILTFQKTPFQYTKGLKIKSSFYEAKKDFKKALEAYKQHIDYESKYFDMENSMRAATLEKRYQSEKREQEIEILRKNDQIKQIQINKNKTLMYFYLAVFIFLVVIIMSIYLRYKQKVKMNDLLQQQKKSLEETLKNLKVAQNEILELERKNSILAMIVTANHELNQPLMILRSRVDMLLLSLGNENFTESQQRYLKKIDESFERIDNILKKYRDSENLRFEEYAGDDSMIIFD
ncbi:MAG: tetratricopeptide repeat protein [Candidatus Cloacimonetes bacterium]|nr:tetratricopeptide repeat protein [Candidatus Cloacimonadota bacterium]